MECLFFAFLCMEMVPSFSVAAISAGVPSFYTDYRQMHKGRVQMQGLYNYSISCSKNSTITTSRLFDGISDLCSERFVL